MSLKHDMGRRSFLKHSTLGVMGITFFTKDKDLTSPQTEEKTSPKVKEYRTLGRTGFEVSDIGGGFLRDAGLITAMLDAGVNYIDTAESYGNQKIIGEAIRGRDRKKIFITSKLEVKKDLTKEGFIKRTRKCLEELGTDYIDCMMMHMPEKIDTLKTAGFHEAMKQLKSEGQIRFLGVSHHGSFWFRDPKETMEKVLLAAAEDGRYDVFLMAYNFLQMDSGERVLQVCKEKNIGTALMKTKPVTTYFSLKNRIETLKKEGKEIHELYIQGLERFRKKAEKAESFMKKHDLQNPDEIRDAAVRFVLSNPNVSTVCCSMKNFDDLNRFVRLSGARLGGKDKKKLSAYTKGCGELYCRHACGVCEPGCPYGVPVNTIMRYHHYFEAQGKEKQAMASYAAIPGIKADRCAECQGLCEKACPFNVPIQGLLIMAHRQLSLA